jgi:autotransporter-associated beta strand protein
MMPTTFNSITINNHAITAGNPIALTAFLSGTGALISIGITLNASQTFTATTAGSGLTFQGPIVTNGHTLTLDGPGGFVLVGAISGSGAIAKNGSGSLQFAGNHSYTGDTTINDGPVRIAGDHSDSRFVTFDGFSGLIGGAGTVKGLTASDPLDPGAANNGTGIFISVGDLDITTNGSLQIDIKGTIPGTEFDQVQVTGAVEIDNVTGLFGAGLNIELVGFTPAPGDKFVIISNDGTDPIANSFGPSGAFFARPEGSTFTVPNPGGGNTTFFITYKGGDGNDVALHVPTTRTWDGGSGANSNWMTAANWVGDVAPAAGDTLVFPPSAVRRMNINNFPAGTKFNSISIDGSYNVRGSAIVLQAGIVSTGNTGHLVNFNGIKLDANQSITRDGQGDLTVASSIDTNGKTLTFLSASEVGAQKYILGGISGAGGIHMAAMNTAIFEATNAYTGPTVISSGNLIVQGTQPASPVQMTGGELLGHLGEVGPLTATGGTISPFFGGPGTLGVNGNLSLNSAAILEISLARDSNGVPFAGKLEVAGGVDLGGSTLSLSFFFSPPQTGDEVTIIDNDGTDPVVGTFGSLPEGALFAFGNATIRISYQGGDGNDVILRVTAVAPVGIGVVKFTNGTDNDAPPGPAVPVGSTVTFHYVVTNTGSTPLEGVRVKDDNGTPGVPGDDFTLAAPVQGDTNENDLLDPGETFIFTAGRIATEGQHTNIGEARGSGVPFGPIVTASNADNHFGGTPPSPTPTPTATPIATPTATATPTPTPTATPSATPTATPSASPGLVGNVSTRLPVGIGDDVLIEGFIVQGPNNSTKKILVRALGPFLTQFGIADALSNPTLEIRDGSNVVVAMNNDWRNTQVGGIVTGDQEAEIEGSGLAPANDLESAIIADLAPGNYTAVVRGVNNTVGTGIVDAYDMSAASPARLANVATRGLIQPGDKLMIAGFIVQQGDVRAVVRAIGPSLSAFGINNALPDTTLQLRDVNGAIVRENDDWESDPAQKQELEDTGLQPSDSREAAIVATIAPGQYTVQVRGKPETTGIGVVEVYFLQ